MPEELNPIRVKREELREEWKSFEAHPYWSRLTERLYWIAETYKDSALQLAARGDVAAAAGPAYAAQQILDVVLRLPADHYHRQDAILETMEREHERKTKLSAAEADGEQDSSAWSGSTL